MPIINFKISCYLPTFFKTTYLLIMLSFTQVIYDNAMTPKNKIAALKKKILIECSYWFVGTWLESGKSD